MVAEGRIPRKIDKISYISSSLYSLTMDSSLDLHPICGFLDSALDIPVPK